MLVLSRQRDEKIVILMPALYAGMPPVEVEVTIVDIRGDKVRLGINAPKEIGVHRSEVLARIRAGEAIKK